MNQARATDRLLSAREASEEYGIPYQTLANWRWRGEGPDYVKGKGRSARVKYRRSSIEAWLDANTIHPQGA